MTTQITMQRTGNAPLIFEGETISQATSRKTDSVRSMRWHTLQLCKAADGRYVVGVTYNTTWQGESYVHRAWVAHSIESVQADLVGYDPADGVGYIPEEKRERVLADIRVGYETAVSELLSNCPVGLPPTEPQFDKQMLEDLLAAEHLLQEIGTGEGTIDPDVWGEAALAIYPQLERIRAAISREIS